MTEETERKVVDRRNDNWETFDPNLAREHFLQTIDIVAEACPGLRYVAEKALSAIILPEPNSVSLMGLPGLGKTRFCEVLAAAIIGARVHIIAGHPDLTSSDILGSQFVNKITGEVTIQWGGMVDAHIIMYDERNRCPPGTQAAVMAAKSERRAIVQAPLVPAKDRIKYMSDVCLFLSAENDHGEDGTFDVPSADRDRDLHQLVFKRIPTEYELDLLMNLGKASRATLKKVADKAILSLDEIRNTRRWIEENMKHGLDFATYVLKIIRCTDPTTKEFRALCENKDHTAIWPILEHVRRGVSTRGSIALTRACQVQAFLFGKHNGAFRTFLMPEDVPPLLYTFGGHRVRMTEAAEVYSRGKGDKVGRWDEYPTDGSITMEKIVAKLNRSGRNPIEPADVLNVALRCNDFTEMTNAAKFKV
jgi:MoxR-like ATPase